MSGTHHHHHDGWLAFNMGVVAALAVDANNRARQQQADAAVLRDARAIRAVHAQIGWLTPEQHQTLHVAGEIEARVGSWRRTNDARSWQWATTSASWIAGLLVWIAAAAIGNSGAAVFAGLCLGAWAGTAAYGALETVRKDYLARLPERDGWHSHGSWGSHSHPWTRRHRHHGDLDGPMY